jgi:hypothetical protein
MDLIKMGLINKSAIKDSRITQGRLSPPLPSQFRILLNALRFVVRHNLNRLLRRKPTPPPADPYASVTAPLRRGPKGRSGAAVAEIEEEDSFRSFPPRRSV